MKNYIVYDIIKGQHKEREENNYMALTGNDGISYSYDSSHLIKELQQDIAEFGKNTIVYAVFYWQSGIKLYTNYDFITADHRMTKEELRENEKVDQLSMEKLLNRLQKQDSIL